MKCPQNSEGWNIHEQADSPASPPSPQTPPLFILARASAPLSALWRVRFGGPVDSDGAIGDPGLVHTSFHPLHDKIQEVVHGLDDVLTVCGTRLKVLDSA